VDEVHIRYSTLHTPSSSSSLNNTKVLRWVIEHTKMQGNRSFPVFRKKKVWDGVIGTIFNMPIYSDQPGATDRRMDRVRTLYEDWFRDHSQEPRNPDVFPLDIRRIECVGLDNKSLTPLEEGDSLTNYSWRTPGSPRTELDPSDPWYVTPSQEKARDIPPRPWPPPQRKQEGNGDLLPTDDTIWKEQEKRDEEYRCRYFVTNLHGGTLIINGMEIKKGCVAGPLPEFAVIESPGGQISFWWGVGGRDWLAEPAGDTFDLHWDILRKREVEDEKIFEHLGLLAGQVWDLKIRDRIRRETTGDAVDDEEEWEVYKNAQGPMELVEVSGETVTGGDEDGDSRECPITSLDKLQQPEVFATEEDELRWLHTRAEPLHEVALKAKNNTIFKEPVGSEFWPGPITMQEPPEEIYSQRLAGENFADNKMEILRNQRDWVDSFNAEKTKQDRRKQFKAGASNWKRQGAAVWKTLGLHPLSGFESDVSARGGDLLKSKKHKKELELATAATTQFSETLGALTKQHADLQRLADSIRVQGILDKAEISILLKECKDPTQAEKDRIYRQVIIEKHTESVKHVQRWNDINAQRSKCGLKQLKAPVFLNQRTLAVARRAYADALRQAYHDAPDQTTKVILKHRFDQANILALATETIANKGEVALGHAIKKQRAAEKDSEAQVLQHDGKDDDTKADGEAHAKQNSIQKAADAQAAETAKKAKADLVAKAATKAEQDQREANIKAVQEKADRIAAAQAQKDEKARADAEHREETARQAAQAAEERRQAAADARQKALEAEWSDFVQGKKIDAHKKQEEQKKRDLAALPKATAPSTSAPPATATDLVDKPGASVLPASTNPIQQATIEKDPSATAATPQITTNAERIAFYKKRLEKAAKDNKMTQIDFLHHKGHTTERAWISEMMNPAPQLIISNDPRVLMLQDMQQQIRRLAVIGLRARAELEGKQRIDIVRNRGDFESIPQYLRSLANALSIENIPHDVGRERRPYDPQTFLWDINWQICQQAIFDAADWDALISSLPKAGEAPLNSELLRNRVLIFGIV
jgi:hypothetical protein